MKTIKLKLTVSEDRNPYLVDENNDVVVKSSNIGWVINNDGRLANVSPEFIISNINKNGFLDAEFDKLLKQQHN